MEKLINCLCGRIAALRGALNLDYPVDMSRLQHQYLSETDERVVNLLEFRKHE